MREIRIHKKLTCEELIAAFKRRNKLRQHLREYANSDWSDEE